MKFFVPLVLLLGVAAAAPRFETTTDATTRGETPRPLKECVDEKDGELVPDHDDPTVFYECLNNGFAYRFHCPPGLIFKRSEKACVYDPDHPFTYATPKSQSNFECRGKKDGFYKDHNDPTIFHECTNGLGADFHCPEQTIFDEKLEVCVNDEDWKLRTHATTEKSMDITTPMMTSTTEQATTQEPTTDAVTTQEQETTEASTTENTTTDLPTEPAEEETTEPPTTVTEEPTTITEEPTTTEEPITVTEEPTTTAEPTTIYNPWESEPKVTRGRH